MSDAEHEHAHHEVPDQAIESDPMIGYQNLLALKHDQTVTGRRCDSVELRAADKGDHVAVYCGNCGILLHRKQRGDDDE